MRKTMSAPPRRQAPPVNPFLRHFMARMQAHLEKLALQVPITPEAGRGDQFAQMKRDWCDLQLARMPPTKREAVEQLTPAPLEPVRTEAENLRQLGFGEVK